MGIIKTEIQEVILHKAVLSIFRIIPEKTIKNDLKYAKGYIRKDYAVVIFNDLIAFQYKWSTNEIYCINGIAKAIANSSIGYASKDINMTIAEKEIKQKGKRIWSK
jgi:phosphopentomutase